MYFERVCSPVRELPTIAAERAVAVVSGVRPASSSAFSATSSASQCTTSAAS
jgi:hypothetical protein